MCSTTGAGVCSCTLKSTEKLWGEVWHLGFAALGLWVPLGHAGHPSYHCLAQAGCVLARMMTHIWQRSDKCLGLSLKVTKLLCCSLGCSEGGSSSHLGPQQSGRWGYALAASGWVKAEPTWPAGHAGKGEDMVGLDKASGLKITSGEAGRHPGPAGAMLVAM